VNGYTWTLAVALILGLVAVTQLLFLVA